MIVPREYIDNYVDALTALSDDMRAKLEESLQRIDYTQDVATIRDEVIAIMDVYCGGSTDLAAQLAAEFYDGIREFELGQRMGAVAQSGRDPAATDGAVRAFAQKLVEDKTAEFITLCLERLDYETRRAAATCVTRNANRDPLKTRYARVPAGNETCDFCIMLASRGPVYHSEASAGAVDHFHANCRCQVVPFWNTYYVGPSRRAGMSMEVEGYDPDALYGDYVEYMTDGKFRDRMARAADRAKGGSGDAKGRDTSHPMVWAEAKRKGLVTLGSIGEVEAYIKGATSYEDLFERIGLVSSEWEHYALSERVRRDIQDTMYRTRQRLMKKGGR